MTTNAIQSSHIYSTYFAPRGLSLIHISEPTRH